MGPDELRGALKRAEILHVSSSIPGRDIVQVLTEIPVQVSSGWHHHPGEEVGYIVAGTVRMEREDHTTQILNTGDGFLIPPGVLHNVTDLGPETGRMLSTYIVDQSQPISILDRAAGV